jgi:uncharacterized membrane protein YhhN
MTLSFFWPLPLVLLVIGALLIAVIWTRLKRCVGRSAPLSP